jgi:hypothetical protein
MDESEFALGIVSAGVLARSKEGQCSPVAAREAWGRERVAEVLGPLIQIGRLESVAARRVRRRDGACRSSGNNGEAIYPTEGRR